MRTIIFKSIWVAALMAVFSIEALAQADVDTPYSLFGIGQVRDKSMNVRLKGMGGLANAMYDIGMINTENPASYARIDSLAFLFDAGFYFKSSNFSTSTLSERSNNASFDYVSMAFGLTQWWKMALGVQPYSVSRYIMTINSENSETGNYTTKFRGTGGLNQAFLGNAFKLGKHLSLGANVYYVFGDTQTETTLYFPDSLYMIGSRNSVDMMVSSFMFDYGLLCDFDLSNELNLSLGVTYSQPVSLKGTQTSFIRSIEVNTDTDVEYLIDTVANTTHSAKIRMPQGIGVGFVLQKKGQWSVGADFNWTQWSKFARQGVTDTLQNSWNVTVGAEFTPRHTSVSNYFTRVTYRFGGFYEHGYLNLNGHSINRMGITAGMSLPLPKTLSKVNFAFELGQYGTREAGLIQERYVKMNVGVSVFEHWFMKRKYR